jgi:hypothetical protein
MDARVKPAHDGKSVQPRLLTRLGIPERLAVGRAMVHAGPLLDLGLTALIARAKSPELREAPRLRRKSAWKGSSCRRSKTCTTAD